MDQTDVPPPLLAGEIFTFSTRSSASSASFWGLQRVVEWDYARDRVAGPRRLACTNPCIHTERQHTATYSRQRVAASTKRVAGPGPLSLYSYHVLLQANNRLLLPAISHHEILWLCVAAGVGWSDGSLPRISWPLLRASRPAASSQAPPRTSGGGAAPIGIRPPSPVTIFH